jgi:hypothetical protein
MSRRGEVDERRERNHGLCRLGSRNRDHGEITRQS